MNNYIYFNEEWNDGKDRETDKEYEARINGMIEREGGGSVMNTYEVTDDNVSGWIIPSGQGIA